MIDGVDYDLDCIISASGFKITTEISRRYAVDAIEGRAGRSLFDHWRNGHKTLHGMSSHGFPNQFFTGFSQGGVAASNTAMYEQQGEHIAYIISQALARGVSVVEPTRDAQDGWCRLIKETSVTNAEFETACTPGYYNNEDGGGGEGIRSHLGEPYGPGFYAFGELLAQWRAAGNMQGMQVTS
jgi:cyclohexanone monooxygenase